MAIDPKTSTLDEMKAWAIQYKLDAFNLARRMKTQNPAHAGYKSKEEAVYLIIQDAADEIEKKFKAWERANPDKD